MARNAELAERAWGAELPAWVERLAVQCDATTQAAVAKAMRYSAAVINQVIACKYPGSLAAVEAAFKGAFQDARVQCPVAGDIALHVCMEHQRAPFAMTNPMRTRLYRACRSGCPHSLIKPASDGGQERAS